MQEVRDREMFQIEGSRDGERESPVSSTSNTFLKENMKILTEPLTVSIYPKIT